MLLFSKVSAAPSSLKFWILAGECRRRSLLGTYLMPKQRARRSISLLFPLLPGHLGNGNLPGSVFVSSSLRALESSLPVRVFSWLKVEFSSQGPLNSFSG